MRVEWSERAAVVLAFEDDVPFVDSLSAMAICYLLWPLQMVRRSDPVPWSVQKFGTKGRVGKMDETCS